jgi:mono/diheme cytochrome c family protein
VALLVGLAAGCDLPGKPKPADRYEPPQNVLSFDGLYRQNCVSCHGADGSLGPGPPLNDALFLALVPDTELRRVVTEGRPGTLMPAFAVARGGRLTAEQVKVLAEGIKVRWGPVKPAPSGAPPYLPEPSKVETIPIKPGRVEAIPVPPRPDTPRQPAGAGSGAREGGAAAFARACASCHGDQGQGGQYDGKSVGGINDPAFLALVSDQELRRIVITGRPDLGMPDYATGKGRPQGFKPLTAAEVAAIVALLADWRHGGTVHAKGS